MPTSRFEPEKGADPLDQSVSTQVSQAAESGRPGCSETVGAVGAISGPMGVCNGTLIDPSYVLTTKSCVLAVTRPNQRIEDRLSQLFFIAPTEHVHTSRAVGIVHLLVDDTETLYALEREAVSRRHLSRPQDALVLLQLAHPRDDVASLDISESVSTALYNQPEVYKVGYMAKTEGLPHHQLGSRPKDREQVVELKQRAIRGRDLEAPVAVADLGAPLLTCDEGRWLVLGALADDHARDDDSGWLKSWGHINLGRPLPFARYLRCDAVNNLWRIQTTHDLRKKKIQPEASFRWPSLPRRYPNDLTFDDGLPERWPRARLATEAGENKINASATDR